MSGNTNESSRVEFHGSGVQQTSGTIHVGGNLNIGVEGKPSKRILQKLRVTNPQHDKARIEEQKGGLLDVSYRWVFSNEDFKTWRDGEANQLLWIRGDPGKGKTMLLCGIIDDLTKPEMGNFNVAYFFCQATNSGLNNAASVLRGLIYSLLSRQPELLAKVEDKVEESGEHKFQDINGWAALCDIFRSIVEEIEKDAKTTYIIVDALDECSNDQDSLLRWIAGLSSTCIKPLVSSRNWPAIGNGLRSATQLSLELNADSISAAVDFFIDERVAKLALSKGLDATTHDQVQNHLKSNSNNTFLWVALVCHELSQHHTLSMDIVKKLEEFPPGLDRLYERMFKQIRDSGKAEICCQILAVQSLTYEPLNLEELCSLVESTKGLLQRPERLQIIQLCGSFLTIKNNTVYFVHQSAKDFLMKRASDDIFPEGCTYGHHSIARQSIYIMSGNLKGNIYNLPSPAYHVDQIKVPNPDPLDPARYSCVYWADHLDMGITSPKQMQTKDRNKSNIFTKIRNIFETKLPNDMGRHVNKVEADVERRILEDGGLLQSFLEEHLLHWIEALSLLGCFGTGIEALAKIKSLLQTSEENGQELEKLVIDAWKFLRYHRTGVEATPLQVYSSALIFTPSLSLVRKQYVAQVNCLLRSPTGHEYWDFQYLQTIRTNSSVSSLTFSPDGKQLVTAAKDGEFNMWDTATGGRLNTLKSGYSAVILTAFSPFAQHMASYTSEGTIYIWHMRTGACLQTFSYPRVETTRNREYSTEHLAFLDDQHIILFTGSNQFCMWNIKTRDCHGTVEISSSLPRLRRTDLFYSLDGIRLSSRLSCFSRNGKRAAWISKDGKEIILLDIISDQLYRARYDWGKYYYDSDSGIRLVMSADGNFLATHIKSKILIWNVAANKLKCIGTLAGLSAFVVPECTLLAWSPGNRYLVSVLWHHIGEWDMTNGKYVRKISQLRPNMSVLDYSSDCSLLVTGHHQELQIWDMTAIRQDEAAILSLLATDFVPETVYGIKSISPDGSLCAFETQGGSTTVINDTATDKLVITIKNSWAKKPSTIGFSPDSKLILYKLVDSKDGSRRLRVYDTFTSRCLIDTRTLRSRWSWQQHWAFSADGSRLALVHIPMSSKKDIFHHLQIWDLATGVCLTTFPLVEISEHGGKMNRLAFSPDGTKVVTYHHLDKADLSHLHIWDAASGSHISKKSWRPNCEGTECAVSPDGRLIACFRWKPYFRWEKEDVTPTTEETCIIVDMDTSAIVARLRTIARVNSNCGFSAGHDINTWDTSPGLKGQILIRWEPYIRWGFAGLQTTRGIYNTQALLNDSRDQINLGEDEIPAGALSGIGISTDCSWMLTNGEPYLWIPPEYRSARINIDGYTRVMTIGTFRDNMYVIRLPET